MLKGHLQSTFSEIDAEREDSSLTSEELRSLGSIITIEGADAAHPLKIDSLQKLTRASKTRPPTPQWLLLSVQPSSETTTEKALVWVADTFRPQFLRIFEDYLSKKITRAAEGNWETPEGNPANRALVANIARIRRTITEDLWQSEGEPPRRGRHWWELWLDPAQNGVGVLHQFAESLQLRLLDRSLAFNDRVVMWICATWQQLEMLPLTAVPIAEIRKPGFIDTIEDLLPDQQDEYVEDLTARIVPAPSGAPAVCHFDTGVARTHQLLAKSLDPADLHSVVGSSGFDTQGHGTAMAGLALLGPLDDLLTDTDTVSVSHRLESVRVLPNQGELATDPQDYGTVTVDAVALVETSSDRRRVFCMPISTSPDRPGQPTLWSATIDALSVGTDIVRNGKQLQLLSGPDFETSRLLIVAAGNVDSYESNHRLESDTSSIEDPAHAWNALTVAAHTALDQHPTDPDYAGWSVMAAAGELSPHSRTSIPFGKRKWPIKPDVCFEGGNVLSDDNGAFEDRHPLLSLRTTGIGNDLALTSANATSAATAQVSRLAALVMTQYPRYWPETVKGLIVHAAEWTPAMQTEFDASPGKETKLELLRRYGWGVPTEDAVLRSSRQSVTLVAQDTFVPFEGPKYKMRRFRLHELPWPTEVLESIGSEKVTMKVTLSYFVEPSASHRGWRQKYSYPSHMLRFELKAPTDLSEAEFVARLNREANDEDDEDSTSQRRSSGSEHWVIGPKQRNLGSLHQDIWEGTGQELSSCNLIGIYPVGGWWKKNTRKDRLDIPVRYSLIISIKSAESEVDLYTPIEAELEVPIEV